MYGLEEEMMKVLLITKMFPFGVEEAFIENEIEFLSESFSEVIIIACEVPEKESNRRKVPSNVRVVRINAYASKKQKIIDITHSFSLNTSWYKQETRNARGVKRKIFLRYFESKALRIFKMIENSRILDELVDDGFILYSYWLFTTARVGTLISERVRPYYMISRAHRYDLYEERNMLNYLPYREMLLSRYDMIFPCSMDGEKHLISKYPKYKSKITTSYLGTFDHGINPKEDGGVFQIVSCSRVEPVERVELLAESIRLLIQKHKVQWTHIGDGSKFKELQKYIDSNGLSEYVVLKGSMKNSDIMDLYKEKHFDVFVNVSSSEGLPVSIMEASSFGIPVIATDVGGTSEIVIDSENGILINETFSADELENQLEKMILYPDDLLEKRKKSREIWETLFQAETNYKKMYSMISGLTEGRDVK